MNGTDESDQPLDWFRARERDENAMVAMSDPRLGPLLMMWHLVRVEPMPEQLEEPILAGDPWAAMWARYWVDFQHVAMVLGVDLPTANRLVQRVQELRVVYPDGTLHATVEEAVRANLETWKTNIRGSGDGTPSHYPEEG